MIINTKGDGVVQVNTDLYSSSTLRSGTDASNITVDGTTAHKTITSTSDMTISTTTGNLTLTAGGDIDMNSNNIINSYFADVSTFFFDSNNVNNIVAFQCNKIQGGALRTLTFQDANGDVLVTDRGTVTQETDINTPVTINSLSGVITTQTANTVAQSSASFIVNNTYVTANSVVLATITNYSVPIGTNGLPTLTVSSFSEKSFIINILNCHDTNALNGILKISFLIA